MREHKFAIAGEWLDYLRFLGMGKNQANDLMRVFRWYRAGMLDRVIGKLSFSSLDEYVRAPTPQTVREEVNRRVEQDERPSVRDIQNMRKEFVPVLALAQSAKANAAAQAQRNQQTCWQLCRVLNGRRIGESPASHAGSTGASRAGDQTMPVSKQITGPWSRSNAS